MMASGLEVMETVVEMGKEIEEAERISFITNLVSGILLLVGGFGGVVAGVAANSGLRLMGRVLQVLAEAGNTGLGLYVAVGDPSTVPLLIFGLVMSAVGLRSPENIKKAANLQKGMTSKAIADINPSAARMAGIARSVKEKSSSIDLCRWA